MQIYTLKPLFITIQIDIDAKSSTINMLTMNPFIKGSEESSHLQVRHSNSCTLLTCPCAWLAKNGWENQTKKWAISNTNYTWNWYFIHHFLYLFEQSIPPRYFVYWCGILHLTLKVLNDLWEFKNSTLFAFWWNS